MRSLVWCVWLLHCPLTTLPPFARRTFFSLHPCSVHCSLSSSTVPCQCKGTRDLLRLVIAPRCNLFRSLPPSPVFSSLIILSLSLSLSLSPCHTQSSLAPLEHHWSPLFPPPLFCRNGLRVSRCLSAVASLLLHVLWCLTLFLLFIFRASNLCFFLSFSFPSLPFPSLPLYPTCTRTFN